jgi:multiple sugar transport system permease protein
MTPAYLSYHLAFLNQDWGVGAAIAFILFVIIIAFTLLQRWVLRERPVSRRRIRPIWRPPNAPPVRRPRPRP